MQKFEQDLHEEHAQVLSLRQEVAEERALVVSLKQELSVLKHAEKQASQVILLKTPLITPSAWTCRDGWQAPEQCCCLLSSHMSSPV